MRLVHFRNNTEHSNFNFDIVLEHRYHQNACGYVISDSNAATYIYF